MAPDSPTNFCANSAEPASPCSPPGTSWFGEDGDYRIRVPAYDITEQTVADSVTGLVWQRAPAETALTWSQAVAYCEGSSLGDATDWRLPSRLELVTIQDFGIDVTWSGEVGPFGEQSCAWSATPLAGAPGFAWQVCAQRARPRSDMGEEAQVRCVRADAPGEGFEVSPAEDMTLDRATGLLWQRHLDLEAHVNQLGILSAIRYCEELVLGGFSDWRLPSEKELATIVDDTRAAPAIDPDAFPDTPSYFFWSSTFRAQHSYDAFAITFGPVPGEAEDLFGGEPTVHGTSGALRRRCVR